MEKSETRKRQCDGEKSGSRSPLAAKRLRPSESEEEKKVSGDLDEDIISWFSADEISITELFKQLESKDSTFPTVSTSRVRFIDDPYTPQLICQSSSSYITINGNEETCGSSFSDSESSLMASVDKRGILGANARFSEGERFWSEEKGEVDADTEARGWDVGGLINGCDGFDRDCGGEWGDVELARFLGEDPFFV